MMYGYESISRIANDPEQQFDRGPHILEFLLVRIFNCMNIKRKNKQNALLMLVDVCVKTY